MTRLIRATLVIARRDYVATVWSRTFLLFLLGPMLPLLFGVGYGALAASDTRPMPRVVRVDMAPQDLAALRSARDRLAASLPPATLASFAGGRAGDAGALLSGTLDRPVLRAPAAMLGRLRQEVGLVVDQARLIRAAGGTIPHGAPLTSRAIAVPPGQVDDGRVDLARVAQLILFFLNMLLAGMMIANLVEEKSSKVIELLAAAVPIDAIFFGKLVGMLAVSLTGIAAWTSIGAIGLGALPPGLVPATPAVGWPAFMALAFCYFAALYLLVGALYLGVGAQAGSMREVQSLSMPLTMAQILIFAVASATITHPDDAVTFGAAVIPWVSPYVMLARAAARPGLWPHLLALGWQMVALLVMVRIGATMFRRHVLGSGRSRPRKPAAAILRRWFGGERA